MIKLSSVNKYFFLGKPNQITAIDDANLEIQDKGLVCLLGPSGCGKTTLLNVIGGLDRADSGLINIDDKELAKASTEELDSIRATQIGYIFQDFYLLDDKTVFENTAISLKLVGIEDKAVITDRVNYCLTQLGLYPFRNKRAGALSGGQRQRLAIARAIVKNPKIIIADEPTGNLDSTNTLEIMNILKTISRDRLVLLVTHERNLASFYADFIAEIKDGRITKAYTNDSSRHLDYQVDNKVYLKDMPITRRFRQAEVKIAVYSEEDKNADIKLIIKGGNIYIDTGNQYNVVDDNSNVEILDESYKGIDETEFSKSDFEYDKYIPDDFTARYTKQFSIGNMLSNGFKTLASYKKGKKLLLLGFVFAAAFGFIAVSNLIGIVELNPSDYINTSKNYITVQNAKMDPAVYEKLQNTEFVEYVLPGNINKDVCLMMDDYVQTSNLAVDVSVAIGVSDVIKKNQLLYGKLPENKHEVLLDKTLADEIIESGCGRGVGISKPEQLLGHEIIIDNLEPLAITGIVNTDGRLLYVDRSLALSVLMYAKDHEEGEQSLLQLYTIEAGEESDDSIVDVALVKDEIKLTLGRLPSKRNEVLLNTDGEIDVRIGTEITNTMGGEPLKVVGYYRSGIDNSKKMLVTADTLENDYICNQISYVAYSKVPDYVSESIISNGGNASLNEEADRQEYLGRIKNSMISSLLVAAIVLLISLIEMLLMLRSSFLSRIKEVGILRAIGYKRRDIYSMFAGEILAISIVTAVPGILLSCFVLNKVTLVSSLLEGAYAVSPLIAVVTFAVLLVFNLLVGMIPVIATVRKTPASILARNDI